MKNKERLNVSMENADEICARIRRESEEDAASVLDRAARERERMLAAAGKEASASTSAILDRAEKDIRKAEERISSIIRMERKRIALNAKASFAEDVVSLVKKRAQAIRSEKKYAEFLRRAVMEGLGVIGDTDAQVLYSYLDENAVAGGLANDIKAEFIKSDFKDAGVVIRSKDGRLYFDNRFEARLKRAYEEIYMKLLKKAV